MNKIGTTVTSYQRYLRLFDFSFVTGTVKNNKNL
jgi:hypothetical protein